MLKSSSKTGKKPNDTSITVGQKCDIPLSIGDARPRPNHSLYTSQLRMFMCSYERTDECLYTNEQYGNQMQIFSNAFVFASLSLSLSLPVL